VETAIGPDDVFVIGVTDEGADVIHRDGVPTVHLGLGGVGHIGKGVCVVEHVPYSEDSAAATDLPRQFLPRVFRGIDRSSIPCIPIL